MMNESSSNANIKNLQGSRIETPTSQAVVIVPPQLQQHQQQDSDTNG